MHGNGDYMNMLKYFFLLSAFLYAGASMDLNYGLTSDLKYKVLIDSTADKIPLSFEKKRSLAIKYEQQGDDVLVTYSYSIEKKKNPILGIQASTMKFDGKYVISKKGERKGGISKVASLNFPKSEISFFPVIFPNKNVEKSSNWIIDYPVLDNDLSYIKCKCMINEINEQYIEILGVNVDNDKTVFNGRYSNKLNAWIEFVEYGLLLGAPYKETYILEE